VSANAASAAQLSAAEAGSSERWTFKVITALCSLAASEPEKSRMVLVNITFAGRAGVLRREDFIRRAAARVHAQAPIGRRPSELAATASVCAIWRIAEREIAAGRSGVLPRIAGVFAYILLAPRRRRPDPVSLRGAPAMTCSSREAASAPLVQQV
jgi:hypothetical protein